jgi:hypothetical protein
MGESEMWLTCTGEKYSVCILGEERDARALGILEVLNQIFFGSTHIFKNDRSKAYRFGSWQSKSCLAMTCTIFSVDCLKRQAPKLVFLVLVA